MTPFDASPQAALAAIRAFDGPLLVDLDETLYLSNTTEDFIDCARPGFAAAAVLSLVDWIKPWRWTGGAVTRDVWRVRVVKVLFPWTSWRWHRRVPHLAKQFGNVPLLDALRRSCAPPVIVTMGFASIVTPLIAAFGFDDARIVATRTSRDRLRGKLGQAMDALGEDTVRRSLAITDSTDDLPLLDACARPLRTAWPGACHRAAHSDVYLPGRYLQRIKRPGERYIVRAILQEDFAFWLLSSIALAAMPLTHTAGLLFLLFSFWAIYECGYVDNDRIAARYEKRPKLTTAFYETPVATPRWQPWIWSLVAAAVAIPLLRFPGVPTLADFAEWLAVLLVTHAWFALYNRFDKRTRVWLYPGLQLARTAAFAVLVPVTVLGAVALSAHVLAKWLPYYVYRFGGRNWPETPQTLTRLLFFGVMSTLIALTQGWSSLMTWSAAALLGWNLFRARKELMGVLLHARRIDRSPRSDAVSAPSPVLVADDARVVPLLRAHK